jgi:hypothetical protein
LEVELGIDELRGGAGRVFSGEQGLQSSITSGIVPSIALDALEPGLDDAAHATRVRATSDRI